MKINNYFHARIEKIINIESTTYILKAKLIESHSFVSQAGQYVYLFDGKAWKPYSLFSSPLALELEFIIKGVLQINPFIKMFETNSILKISRPYGEACINSECQNYVCIATGIAISPILSIARYLRESTSFIKLHVIWLYTSKEQLAAFISYFQNCDSIKLDCILRSNDLHVKTIRQLANENVNRKNLRCFIYGSYDFVKTVYFELNSIFENIVTDIPMPLPEIKQ